MVNVRQHAASAAAVAVVLASLLSGCGAGVVAVQAAQATFGGVMLANAEDRSPFVSYGPSAAGRTERELEVLNSHLLRAECGESESQFWLGSALRNDFNAAANRVEIYKWYLLAERGGYAPAGDELKAIAGSMSQQQVGQARARVQAFKPRVEGCPTSTG